MHYDEHVKRTLRLYGRRAEDIHLFIDQFWPKYNISHRRLLHHRLGIELIVRRYGEKAWGPAKLHILDDLGCVPDTWLDHDPHVVYLDPGDKAAHEEDLITLYGRETYDQVCVTRRKQFGTSPGRNCGGKNHRGRGYARGVEATE